MAGIKAFKTINTTGFELGQVQDNVAAALNPILSQPLVSGHIIKNIHLKIGDNVIQHSLQKPVAWIICGLSAPATIYDKQASNKLPNVSLILNASAACTISLFIF